MACAREVPDEAPSSRKGAAAIELVFVTPLLALVMLGCVDFGRFPSTAIAVRNAARVGAEFARTHPSTPATQAKWTLQLRSEVEEEMRTVSAFDTKDLTLDVTRIDLGKGRSQVRVGVRYPFRTLVTWDYPGLALPDKLELSHQVLMEVPEL